MGYLVAFLIAILGLLIYLIISWRNGFILVDEMEIGVIFNKRNNSFAYFIDSDVAQTPKINKFKFEKLNHTLPKYRYFLSPFSEELKAKIKKGPYKSGDVETFARTKEGIPVTVHWSVSCRIDVQEIKEGIEHKMARALPDNAGSMVKGKGIPSVRHIIEQKTIYELYKYGNGAEDGAIKTLEKELCEAIVAKVSGVFGMVGMAPGNQLQIKSIEMPPKIEKALEIAHQRKIQTETVTKALNGLKKAIADFSPQDMEHLAELERLRLIDDKSASMVYWMNNSLNSGQTPAQENGVKQENN